MPQTGWRLSGGVEMLDLIFKLVGRVVAPGPNAVITR